MTKKPAKAEAVIAADPPPPQVIELPSRFLLRLVLVIGLIALGDVLFFGNYVGISLLIFFVALAAALLLAARPPANHTAPAAALLIVALLPLIEDVHLLSFSIAVVALALFAAFIAAGAERWEGILRSAVALLTIGIFQFIPDLILAHRAGGMKVRPGAFTSWLLPLGCGVVFLALFGVANPLIDEWIIALNPLRLLEQLEITRVIFWVCLLALIWPFVLPRMREKWRAFNPPLGTQTGGLTTNLFTPQAIFRSLVLFNLLFAVQTGMDVAYLWGGIALPEGMTYANYAHRGAYPLIVTALLAAGFVLLAMPAGHRPSPLIRALVLVFIAQNVMLVISSMLRLELYIETYSLTLLRVAAFIWMGLVALGLALILTRILSGKSNAWLVGTNLTALAATLYICAFADFAGLVASYNVTRHIEHGAIIDPLYIHSLGPAALPAIHHWRSHEQDDHAFTPLRIDNVASLMEKRHRQQMENWRGWSFHGQRLLNYLDAQASATQPSKEETPKVEG